jgi:hypothetical protein
LIGPGLDHSNIRTGLEYSMACGILKIAIVKVTESSKRMKTPVVAKRIRRAFNRLGREHFLCGSFEGN